MHLADSMEDHLSCFHSSETHSAEADTRARPTVIRVNDLIGRQRHPKPIWEDDECSWWTVVHDRQALDEVPFAMQARSGNKFNEQREFVQKNIPGLPGLRIGGTRRCPVGSVPRLCKPENTTEICHRDSRTTPNHQRVPRRYTDHYYSHARRGHATDCSTLRSLGQNCP